MGSLVHGYRGRTSFNETWDINQYSENPRLMGMKLIEPYPISKQDGCFETSPQELLG